VVKNALATCRKGQSGRHMLLCFEEDMCFDEVPQRFPGPFAEKLLIEGPGFHFTTCSLTSKEALANE
jgi:hypothetical protein